MGRSVLRELVEKTVEVVPGDGKWKVAYLGFARGGWTAEAQQYAKELAKRDLKGENWQVAGMQLLDLQQVDHDLAGWTGSGLAT